MSLHSEYHAISPCIRSNPPQLVHRSVSRLPLCIDLFCGLGGWAEGFIAEGYQVIGFDIERHDYGTGGYPGELVLQDVLTLHGSQFKDADVIVASPPCQEFSYMAMPWTRAKQIARALRGEGEFPSGYRGSRTIEDLTRLFDACFRIQREARNAAGRPIPLIVENVKGAEAWVGDARWHHGSFYLWGDVPALMPPIVAAQKFNPDGTNHPQGSWFKIADSKNRGVKNRDSDGYQRDHDQPFGWKAPRTSSRAPARKAASAQIAKIPFPLADHIARVFKPAPLGSPFAKQEDKA